MTASVHSVAELTVVHARGERMKFLFFWGHQTQPDGQIGPGCLSQWWPAPFTVDGHVFATAEHYVTWRKATLFGDHAAALKILDAPHPHAAKALGARVTGFDQQMWDEHRVPIVVAGNLAKFRQHPALSAFLVTTGRRVLVEASPVDRIWGIGLTRDDPAATDPRRWRGLNLLGFTLMQVRDTLNAQHANTP
jgi:ribA/ribD-fused uncharacterized protein